ncbi:MAG: anthranilate synthase component I family protein, partial [Sulfurovaceae bacterium]|nr:anthranilate synthase component I family protein [Sulfurovaceae bacterium]
MIKQILFDQLTPVAMYGKVKELFHDEITMLFESVVNNSDGNFSFITIGSIERVAYKNNQTYYTNSSSQITEIDQDPFSFLQNYYQKLDQEKYKQLASEAGFAFVDGFIGFIGYDMVKVFEPILKPYMDTLNDPLDTPDLDLVRPAIILAFSHKTATLTIIQNDERYSKQVADIESLLDDSSKPQPLLPAILEGEGEFSIEEERFK